MVSEARASLARYGAFYNARPRYSSIEDRTPDEGYLGVQALRRQLPGELLHRIAHHLARL
jgi:hypothetical protein